MTGTTRFESVDIIYQAGIPERVVQKNDYRLRSPFCPQFPPVLLLSLRSLNSVDPAISEPATGYRSTHVPNLTDKLSTAKERRLNQFGMAVLIRCATNV